MSRPTSPRAQHFLTWQGETLTHCQWAKRLGMSHGCIASRVLRGWTVEAALSTPSTRKPQQLYTYQGASRTATSWARRLQSLNVDPGTMRWRLARWPVERALTEPRNPNGRHKKAPK